MITISPVPTHYPECCLSISEGLFTCIARCLSEVTRCLVPITESRVEKTTILSIGCGTGFLESLLTIHLQEHGFCVKVAGVEVPSADVRYLTSDLVSYVSGTRGISHRAASADILLFIYPRDGDLIRQYLTLFSSNVRMVLWLGPRADWTTQSEVLHHVPGFCGPCMLDDTGLAAYEVAFAFRNLETSQSDEDARSDARQGCLTLDIDSI